MRVITSELLRKFFNKLSDIFAKKSEVLTGGRQTTTSSADDGVNVYTFSDGSTISVKNGSKGSTGAANLANNLTTTGSGYALDARQGKALADKISTHTHTSMKDCGDGREITFAYSKEGLPLSESPWIATWHGGELRAISRDLLVPSWESYDAASLISKDIFIIGSDNSRYCPMLNLLSIDITIDVVRDIPGDGYIKIGDGFRHSVNGGESFPLIYKKFIYGYIQSSDNGFWWLIHTTPIPADAWFTLHGLILVKS